MYVILNRESGEVLADGIECLDDAAFLVNQCVMDEGLDVELRDACGNPVSYSEVIINGQRLVLISLSARNMRALWRSQSASTTGS